VQRDTAEIAAGVAYLDACDSVGCTFPDAAVDLIPAAVAYMRTALGYRDPSGDLVGLIRYVRDIDTERLASPADFLSTEDDGSLSPLVLWLRRAIDHYDDQTIARPPLPPADRDEAIGMLQQLSGTIALPTAGAALLVWCLTEVQKLRAMIGGRP